MAKINLENVQINIYPKDSFDNKYCAIIMLYNEKSGGWYNSGLVVRENTDIQAFKAAKKLAEKNGYWE